MNGELISINPNDYPLSNRYSNGSFIIDTETQGEIAWMESKSIIE